MISAGSLWTSRWSDIDAAVDHELVAAVAGEDAARADDAIEPLGRLDQKLVADEVAHGVVDMLEIVEIDEDEHDAVARRLTPRPFEIELHLLGEVGAVGESGQRVVMRHVVDAFLGLDARGDVFEQRHSAALHRTHRDLAVLLIGKMKDDLAAAMKADDLEKAVGSALRDGAP